jgi:hypothetical protein
LSKGIENVVNNTVVETDGKFVETVQAQVATAVAGDGASAILARNLVKEELEEGPISNHISQNIILEIGETCSQFYYKNGIFGEMKELLSRVRDGRADVSEISGMAPIVRQTYDISALSKIFLNFESRPQPAVPNTGRICPERYEYH